MIIKDALMKNKKILISAESLSLHNPYQLITSEI